MNRRQRRSATKGNVSQEAASLLATARGLYAAGRRVEADVGFRQVLNLDPKNAGAMTGLAILKYESGDLAEASRLLKKALRNAPRLPEANQMMGVVLAREEKHEEAIERFRQTLRLEPDDLPCTMRLGNSLVATARYSEAATCFERVVEARPTDGTALNNLGLAQLNLNLFDDAVDTMRRAVEQKPDQRLWQSNLLMCLNYSSTISPERLFEEHRIAGRAFSRDPEPSLPAYPAEAMGDRRLRVGFVSPDFKSHSVAYFFEPLLAGFDTGAVETFLYAEVAKPDETTVRLHALADHWYSTIGRTDDEIFGQIRADRIDVLVDLAGHTRGSRLGVFSGRAAPVQVTWLGYGYTTGLAAMDFRITDEFCDPKGSAGALATETLYRMPDGFLCFRPDPIAPDVADPPCLTRDFITFGSFNYPSKINENVVALWARVMKRVANSHVLVKNRSLADPALRDRMEGWFEKHGIERTRVDLVTWSRSTHDHLSAYGGMDIALDSFPYNGTTTTCEALWMGVPVVTMVGDRHVSRVAGCLLRRIGMPELVAAHEDEFVAIACDLAGDRDRLVGLRRELRDRMRSSTLMDEKDFARRMEAAFREMLSFKVSSRVAV